VTNHHSFNITVTYDDKQVTRSQGSTDIEGWDDAPHQLVKAQVVARELRNLAAKWATIEADETAKYQATLTEDAPE
jgi:hypothetical protein